MTYFMSVILGFVQGVAEFLPISSSGHLTLFQHFFGMEEPDQLFNVLLHFATLLAVCVVYWRDIWEMIVEFFCFFGDLFSHRSYRGNPPEARRMVLLIIVGTLPLFLVLPIEDRVEAFGNNPLFVCVALLITGCILFLSDQMARGHKTARNATLLDVLIVGVAQGCATIPGLSRSGCTISAGMVRGFDRKFAVRYSFLMSLPAVLGATLLKVLDVMELEGGVPKENLPKYLLGMAVAAVVGYFSIQLVKLLADKGRFGFFAFYCWGAGALFILLNIMGWSFVPTASPM
ncbi:undecaprenyl-diphosphate phosphatase [Colidextribacter sp. OB.20]|uniref:undecaprenyl-diphosphate phosphatase n=1 Tax=Colidextribacter sp. OB.20 TaxID=2304568 RepID=UPI001FADF464|nr:undecaprenyl-diphosphate phosphatase [Colidextribacter sp. OB.20]